MRFGFSNCFLKVTIVSKQNQWHLFKVTGVSVHRPILRWIKNVVHLLVKMTTELMNLCVTSISNHSTISTVQKIWIWILEHVRRNSIVMCVFWSWYMVFIQWTRYRAHVNVCVCVCNTGKCNQRCTSYNVFTSKLKSHVVNICIEKERWYFFQSITNTGQKQSA